MFIGMKRWWMLSVSMRQAHFVLDVSVHNNTARLMYYTETDKHKGWTIGHNCLLVQKIRICAWRCGMCKLPLSALRLPTCTSTITIARENTQEFPTTCSQPRTLSAHERNENRSWKHNSYPWLIHIWWSWTIFGTCHSPHEYHQFSGKLQTEIGGGVRLTSNSQSLPLCIDVRNRMHTFAILEGSSEHTSSSRTPCDKPINALVRILQN